MNNNEGPLIVAVIFLCAGIALSLAPIKERGAMLDCIYSNHEISVCEEILDFTWKVEE